MIDLRTEWICLVGIKSPLLHVGDYTHNLGQLIEIVQIESLPNGVLAGKKLLRQYVIDDDDGW